MGAAMRKHWVSAGHALANSLQAAVLASSVATGLGPGITAATIDEAQMIPEGLQASQNGNLHSEHLVTRNGVGMGEAMMVTGVTPAPGIQEARPIASMLRRECRVRRIKCDT